nr:acidic leucine-rich nuclear phosphoprotein 32 family member B-like [Neodiprion pinetum]
MTNRGADYGKEDDEDVVDSDADTLVIDHEQCIDDSDGDYGDDYDVNVHEFEHNLVSEHHLESASSSGDEEEKEEKEEEEEDEEEEEAEVEDVWNSGDGDGKWVVVNVWEVDVEFEDGFDSYEVVYI